MDSECFICLKQGELLTSNETFCHYRVLERGKVEESLPMKYSSTAQTPCRGGEEDGGGMKRRRRKKTVTRKYGKSHINGQAEQGGEKKLDNLTVTGEVRNNDYILI